MSATAIRHLVFGFDFTNMLKKMNYMNVYSTTKMQLLKLATYIFKGEDY